MSMKKLGSILLSTAMVMSLAACGSQNTSAPAATTDDSATKEEAAAPAESAVAADTDVSGSTLEVAVTYTGDQATTFQMVALTLQRISDELTGSAVGFRL